MNTVVGDLVKMAEQGTFDILIHGCNCFHVMGGGIARQLSLKYPEVLVEDKKTVKGDRRKLGHFSAVEVSAGFSVCNAYTQYLFGEDPSAKDGVLVDYDAVRSAFRGIKVLLGGRGLRFGIPKIGAGLARGDWGKLSQIIEEEMDGEDLTLVLYGESNV